MFQFQLHWSPHLSMSAVVVQDNCRLAVTAAPYHGQLYCAIATETPSDTIAGVLAEHRYRLIGDSYKSMLEAQRACEVYVTAWRAKRRTGSSNECDCKEIQEVKP
jgi:hypothetical protein